MAKRHIWGYTVGQSLPKPLRHFKTYSSKSLGLLASQVVFPYFTLNHIPHLTQQLTPDEEDLYFGGAAVLSSSFDNFLKSFQAKHCRVEVGSNTLRLDVFMPGLNGSSLGGELPLNPFSSFGSLVLVKDGELLEDEWEGSQPIVVAVCCLYLFSFLYHSF